MTTHLQAALDELERADEMMKPGGGDDREQASALIHRAMIYTQAAMQRLGKEPRDGAVPARPQSVE